MDNYSSQTQVSSTREAANVNILGQHKLFDPDDWFNEIGSATFDGFVDLSTLMERIDCRLEKLDENSDPPGGFVRAHEDYLSTAGLTMYDAKTFFEVQPQRPSVKAKPQRWREIQYTDEVRTMLVTYPNDGDRDNLRLMAYALGPVIQGQQALDIVSLELCPDPEQKAKYLATGPNIRYPEHCRDKDGSVSCISESCPEGKICKVWDCSETQIHTRTVCECVLEQEE
ncbi:hypothetical protein [Streptomyces canus]|uniref:hypothetical protein n=1 Tax=Streptomyces canus TaxID=58343 RepID=UPI0022527E44|nr:hypothetical protein [Streptomyces canus]MCX4856642.1 hypothetical protein [Streptomyces canus]